jgi:hypothetical protein
MEGFLHRISSGVMRSSFALAYTSQRLFPPHLILSTGSGARVPRQKLIHLFFDLPGRRGLEVYIGLIDTP